MENTVVIIRDYMYGDVEICRLEYNSRETAQADKEDLFEHFFAVYGSGSRGFYGRYLDDGPPPPVK